MVAVNEVSNDVELYVDVCDNILSAMAIKNCVDYVESKLGSIKINIAYEGMEFKKLTGNFLRNLKADHYRKELNRVDYSINVSGRVKTNQEHRLKTLKAIHKIYCYALDGNIWEIKLVTSCKCKSSTSKYDDFLLSICSMYAQGILNNTDLSQFTTAKIKFPDNYDDLNVYHNNFFDPTGRDTEVKSFTSPVELKVIN